MVSLTLELIPENWSHSNNTWLPSCGQAGLHSHVKINSSNNRSYRVTAIRYCILIIGFNNFSVHLVTHLYISAGVILTKKVMIYCRKINNPIHWCNALAHSAVTAVTEAHCPAHISCPHTLKQRDNTYHHTVGSYYPASRCSKYHSKLTRAVKTTRSSECR